MQVTNLRYSRLKICATTELDAPLPQLESRGIAESARGSGHTRMETVGTGRANGFALGLRNVKPEMKVVGKRRGSQGGLAAADGFLKLVCELRAGRPFIPRGVYRFRTHEEKDAWTLKMLAR
jgi:hypothetical protein